MHRQYHRQKTFPHSIRNFRTRLGSTVHPGTAVGGCHAVGAGAGARMTGERWIRPGLRCATSGSAGHATAFKQRIHEVAPTGGGCGRSKEVVRRCWCRRSVLSGPARRHRRGLLSSRRLCRLPTRRRARCGSVTACWGGWRSRARLPKKFRTGRGMRERRSRRSSARRSSVTHGRGRFRVLREPALRASAATGLRSRSSRPGSCCRSMSP